MSFIKLHNVSTLGIANVDPAPRLTFAMMPLAKHLVY